MLFDLPSPAALYDALTTRDVGFDGRAWVGVTTTGIFCRLSCPARKPKFENCTWHASVGECLRTGYRPCKRCKPLHLQDEPALTALLAALDVDPDRRWGEDDIVAAGFDASTIRRASKRAFGMTFLDLARHRRLARGFTTLTDGGRVLDAQIAAGFESGSAFRAAFAKWLGIGPGGFAKDALLRAAWIETALGDMVAVADQHSLHLLEFADRKALPTELKRLHQKHPIGLGRFAIIDRLEAQLTAYLGGTRPTFDIPLTLHGTAFTKDVWEALIRIPAGQTQTYGGLAQSIGRPTAARAVALANGANQIAILIPCHRIIGADGALTGYGGGLWRKDQLITLERHYAKDTS